MNALLRSRTTQRILLHTGFWFGLWGLLASNVLESTLSKPLLLRFALYAWVVVSFALTTYTNLYVLLPRLLRRHRYVRYGLTLTGLVLLIAWLNDVLLGYLFGTQPMVMQRFTTLLGFTLFTLGLKLLRDDLATQLRVSTLERIQAEQELQLLKSQVNPHFLFNSLNGIYAMALSDSGRTADTVLKLADLMRYMVSMAPLPSVSLSSEIDYLNNYLSLERIRLNPAAEIIFRQQGDFSSAVIAPMLLLPFVENAFKHGVETQVQNVHVEIDASLQRNEFFFQVINTKPASAGKPSGGATRLGLTNVKKRLQLLYTNRHELTLTDTDTNYTVTLWLCL